jgi:DNA-binding response OmpR family regulator
MAKEKILLVDADQKSIRLLEVSLRKAGFSVTTSDTGTDALKKVEISPPDLIISDTKMPKIDGYEFCRQIKEKPKFRNIPFIFLTRQTDVDDKIRGLELGVDDYLTKPIFIKEVIARVKLLLEKKRTSILEVTEPESKLSGSLDQMGVVDVIQTLEMSRKTGVVNLRSNEKVGKIYFQDGRIINAEAELLQGERAVYRMLLWAEGNFSVDFGTQDDIEDRIEISTQGLIMEGMRRIDEWERYQEQLPPLNTVLVLDPEVIKEEHPDAFPQKIEEVLAEFADSQCTIIKAITHLPYDDLESLTIVAKLYFEGYLTTIEKDFTQVTVADETISQVEDAFADAFEDFDFDSADRPSRSQARADSEEIVVVKPVVASKSPVKREDNVINEADFEMPKGPKVEISFEVDDDYESEAEYDVTSSIEDEDDYEPPHKISRDQIDFEMEEDDDPPPRPEPKSKIIPFPQAPKGQPIPQETHDFWEADRLVQTLSGLGAAAALKPQSEPASAPEQQPILDLPPLPDPEPGLPIDVPLVNESQTATPPAGPKIDLLDLDTIGQPAAIRPPVDDLPIAPQIPEPIAESTMTSTAEIPALTATDLFQAENTDPRSLLADEDMTMTSEIPPVAQPPIAQPPVVAPPPTPQAPAQVAPVVPQPQTAATATVSAEPKKRSIIPIILGIFFALIVVAAGTGFAVFKIMGGAESRPAANVVDREAGDLDTTNDPVDVIEQDSELAPVVEDPEGVEGVEESPAAVEEPAPAPAAAALERAAPVVAARQSEPVAPARAETVVRPGSPVAANAEVVRPSARVAAPPQASSAPSPAEQAERYYQEGRAHYNDEDVSAAIRSYIKAIKANPSREKYYTAVGLALFDLRRDRDSIRYLKKAIQLNPRNANAHLTLGMVYDSAGIDNMAITEYKKFLQLSPNHRRASEIRRLVAQKESGQ